MSKNYEPKFGRVLIEREVNEKTNGGIILPESAIKRHAHSEGTIIALGETAGWTDVPDPVNGELTRKQIFKIGDKVLFGRHAGAWLDQYQGVNVKEGNERLFICADEDILAVIKE